VTELTVMIQFSNNRKNAGYKQLTIGVLYEIWVTLTLTKYDILFSVRLLPQQISNYIISAHFTLSKSRTKNGHFN